MTLVKRKESVRLVIRRVAELVNWCLRHTYIDRIWNLLQSERQLAQVGRVGERCFIGNHSVVIQGKFMHFGNGVGIGPFSRVEVVGRHESACLYIADGVLTGWNTHIACAQSVTIGCDTLIASGVYISDHNHSFSSADTYRQRPAATGVESAAVSIGERCWIGEHVAILPGVTIGDDCVVGAGSIVTRDLPSGCLAVGVPARPIKRRSEAGVWQALP